MESDSFFAFHNDCIYGANSSKVQQVAQPKQALVFRGNCVLVLSKSRCRPLRDRQGGLRRGINEASLTVGLVPRSLATHFYQHSTSTPDLNTNSSGWGLSAPQRTFSFAELKGTSLRVLMWALQISVVVSRPKERESNCATAQPSVTLTGRG